MARSRRDEQRPDPVRAAIDVCPAGESAVLARLGEGIAPAINARVVALAAALEEAPPAGMVECVPGYASLLVTLDPLATSAAEIADAVRVAAARTWRARRQPTGRLVSIPVHYGGEHGADLVEVARVLGCSPDEVIRGHSEAEYRVYFLGFLAGFPYLGGLPESLAVPRLAVPRTRVPAGSVAIAERQTGIYPVASPGGWRVIGRTPLRLFDVQRDPPALLAPSDRVRFVPVADAPAHDMDEPAAPRAQPPAEPPEPGAIPWLRVERPGLATTVQDAGRPGYARYGVSPSGAADPDAPRRGNRLLGNPPDAAALEIPLGNAAFTVAASCLIALTGAPGPAWLDGRPIPFETALWAEAGSQLALDTPVAGMRVYLCVAGGVAVLRVLGSRSTDPRAGFGGLDGRALVAGDSLWRGASSVRDELAGRTLASERGHVIPSPGGVWTLRVLPGPDAAPAPAALVALLARAHLVDPRADRMGVRLRTADGEPVPGGGQVLSAGVPRGAVQLPPGGEPVLLGADAQTTGGYRVPLVVARADWWQVGQMRPGDRVRLELITEAEAVAALLEHERSVAATVPRLSAPDPARLMHGFAEWSDDADPRG